MHVLVAGMKVVVDALVHSIRPLGNVMLICSFLFMIFAILGTQLFMGRFFRCEPHPDFADDQATAVYRGYNQVLCLQPQLMPVLGSLGQSWTDQS